jgi:hypothetical protein
MKRKSRIWVALLAGTSLFGTLESVAVSPLLIGESASEIAEKPVAPMGSQLALNLQVASNLPMNRPFRATGGENFQFQVSRSFAAEVELGWSKNLSFGASGGWESFETRLDTSAGINTEFQKASVSLVPILFSAKYRFKNAGWTPTLELGMGMGLYRYVLDSTNASATADKASSASFLAQALVGSRFFWTEDWSLDFAVGYRYTSVGNRNLNNGIQSVEARSFTGLYSRGGLSYRF